MKKLKAFSLCAFFYHWWAGPGSQEHIKEDVKMPLFGQLLSWESNLKCMTVALFLSKREKKTKQSSLVLFSVGHLATFILHFPLLLLKPKEIH